jgi:predicted nucleotidyltransferase
MVKKTNKPIKKYNKKISIKSLPTLKLKSERDIAMDFAQKVYQKFDKMIKSIILFGSQVKQQKTSGSDIDIIIVIDDATVKFNDKLIVWYREELGKIIKSNPYKQDLHINTVKLTTWWDDLSKGDPTIINILRYGETLIDFGGFFNPLKILLQEGRIKPTPESIYTALNRVPMNIRRSRMAEISAIEGCYWAFVDSAQSLLMALRVLPPSPEHIAILLKENLVDKKLLKMKYVVWFRDLHDLHRKIMHDEVKNIGGGIIDEWQERSEEFFKVTLKLIDEII